MTCPCLHARVTALEHAIGRHVSGGPSPKPGEKTEHEQDAETIAQLRAALTVERHQHGELRAGLEAEMETARLTAARVMQEMCAKAAESAEDLIEVFRRNDGRVTVLDNKTDLASQRWLCAEAIRAIRVDEATECEQ